MTFHLSKPDPDFLFKLALPDYDAVPASTPLHARLPLPATGPYKIAGYQKKGVVVLVRNPRFHVWSAAAQPEGYPDRIVERYRYTGASAIHAVERGTADITADGLDQTWPPALAASLQTRYSSQLYAEPPLTILGLWLNTRLAPFNDVRVRQAFNLAVDRNRLARINAGEVACQYLPPNVNGYSYYCPYNGPNLAKARRLVAESGTKGQPVTIWIYDIPAGHRNGAYLVSVLQSIGYKARVEYVPHNGQPTWRPDRQAGVGGSVPDYPSANDIFLQFLCSSYTTKPATNSNPAGICDRHLDAQVARAQVARDDQPCRRGRRLAQHRPHADRQGAVRAVEGLPLDRLRRPAGRQLQVLLAVGGDRAGRRVPRPALGALSLVLASAVHGSKCSASERDWHLACGRPREVDAKPGGWSASPPTGRSRERSIRLHIHRAFEVVQVEPNRKRRPAALLQSPLTDSNRRPPPYHGRREGVCLSRFSHSHAGWSPSRAAAYPHVLRSRAPSVHPRFGPTLRSAKPIWAVWETPCEVPRSP